MKKPLGFVAPSCTSFAMAKFVRRERKHRRLVKQKPDASREPAEPVPDVIIPESQVERAARRARLAAEIQEQQPEAKIPSKKRKRLDKYIDTKLRKEENLELLKKLAAHKVDTSLLQSSKKLGRVTETKRERYSRALQERNAGLNGVDHDVLFESRREAETEPEDDEGKDEDETSVDEPAVSTAPNVPDATHTASTFGSGLKRPLETDEAGRPVLRKRKRRKVAKEKASALSPEDVVDGRRIGYGVAPRSPDIDSEYGDEQEDEWNGFGADDGSEEPSLENEAIALAGSDSSNESNESDSNPSDLEDDGNDSASTASTSQADADEDRPGRVSAFKAWADVQRNAAVDFTPSAIPTSEVTVRASFKPREPSPDATLAPLQPVNSERTSRPTAAVTIPRSDDIQAVRLELPVVQEEQKIMEAIHSNPVVVICGATGSGKTTQVPQMMFESGYGSHIGNPNSSGTAGLQSKGMIGVTQPRRVAAVSVAERVATEFGPTFRSRVAHQVRYDSNVNRDTAIKFMTDGILLREISQDFILSKYSAIVIDEAHERSVNTDILIGMLSRIVLLRSELALENQDKHYPLKLIIMSATLRVSDFAQNQRLFRSGAPPIVQAEGRQYPVTVHFSRRTQRDFIAETVNKVSRAHRKLPPGGILVFLTSQNEIQTVARQLKQKLGGGSSGSSTLARPRDHHANDMPFETDDYEDGQRQKNDFLEGEEEAESDSDADIIGLDDDDVEDREFQVEDQQPSSGAQGSLKPQILPLYAALQPKEQLRVFQPPPAGSRLIVLATNVAETSLTIPGTRYVFDCGRSKEKRYDVSTGVQTFEIDWISKASASQRSGRAGRTGPGHCYRLYSSAVYERFFAEHIIPEILRTPLESTVLQLKSMDIDNVVNFPFPTAPDSVQLAQAERLLRSLGAISEKTGQITETGRQIMAFPVSPRFGKMLLLAQRNGITAHTIALVAGLAVGDLFIPEAQLGGPAAVDHETADEDESEDDRRAKSQAENLAQTAAQKRHQAYTRAHATLARWDDQSDVMKLLTAVAAHAEASGRDKPMAAASKFCEEFFLREKGMSEVQQLRHQLQNIVSARQHTSHGGFTEALPLPNEKERKMLNQIVAAGFIDQVAIRSNLIQGDASTLRKPRRAIEVPYRSLVASAEPDRSLPPHEQELQRSVFVHPSSILSHLSVDEMPSYIVYSHLSRAAPATIDSTKTPKTRMHPLATLGPKQLAVLAEGTPLLDIGKPLKLEEEWKGADDGLPRRRCWVSVGLKAPDGGGQVWPLPAWKVVQVRKQKEWEVEKVLAR